MNIISKSGSLRRSLVPLAALLIIGMVASGCASMEMSGGGSSGGGSSGGGSSGGGSSGGGSSGGGSSEEPPIGVELAGLITLH